MPFVIGKEQIMALAELKLGDECDETATLRQAPMKMIEYAIPVELGAVPLQGQAHGPTVESYASRCLSDVERRFLQNRQGNSCGLVSYFTQTYIVNISNC